MSLRLGKVINMVRLGLVRLEKFISAHIKILDILLFKP